MDGVIYTNTMLLLLMSVPLEQKVLLYPYVMSSSQVSDLQPPVVGWEMPEVTC